MAPYLLCDIGLVLFIIQFYFLYGDEMCPHTLMSSHPILTLYLISLYKIFFMEVIIEGQKRQQLQNQLYATFRFPSVLEAFLMGLPAIWEIFDSGQMWMRNIPVWPHAPKSNRLKSMNI